MTGYILIDSMRVSSVWTLEQLNTIVRLPASPEFFHEISVVNLQGQETNLDEPQNE